MAEKLELDLKYKANSLHFCEEWSSAGVVLKGLTSLSIVLNRNLRVIEIFANNLRKVMLSRCFYFFVIFTEQVFIENIISLQIGLAVFALKFKGVLFSAFILSTFLQGAFDLPEIILVFTGAIPSKLCFTERSKLLTKL